MNLPAYKTHPGFPGSTTDIIEDRVICKTPNEIRPVRWVCSYQGETDYESNIGKRGRLHFRWGKCPWRWSFEKPETTYWNYRSEAEFQQEFNGSWGILRGPCANPTNPETLAAFRTLYHPDVVTGYFDHVQRRWIVCEPTYRELSTETWKQTPEYQQFCKDHKLAA